MSKLLTANPERQSANVPAAPHINHIAAPGVDTVCSKSRNVPDPIIDPICIVFRTNVTDRPAEIIESAIHAPTFAITKYAAHGAADRRPAFVSVTLNVVLK